MSNFSADILRELINKVFGIDPKNVILSGEISPNKTWHSFSTEDNSCDYHHNVFTFCKDCFHELEIGSYKRLDSAMGETLSHKIFKHKDLASALEAECPDSIFILVVENGKYKDATEHYQKVTIFKAPKWKEYLKIEKEDIARWEEWLRLN